MAANAALLEPDCPVVESLPLANAGALGLASLFIALANRINGALARAARQSEAEL
eukprot:CAMPEP_0167777308 /NCGR_PEP_ID=MMETSP0111_2-20121227/3620_1 /TAXON_ID=91324 /ORGANISM="Lotharella globosa, Strain CCCM811" /LENGTH=54 /DNA_ID=CAMNT_0007667475 /DNA_START=331 /DNA_END=495 /DNA_ORIENTATION=-